MPKPPGVTAGCGTCKFFDPSYPAVDDPTVGSCFRYPPLSSTDQNVRGTWPVVDSSDWCGEWVQGP